MRLLGLHAEVKHVGQLLVQQINHRAADFFAQVVLCRMQFGFHKISFYVCGELLDAGSASHESSGICATLG